MRAELVPPELSYLPPKLSYLPPKLSYAPPKPELRATRFKMRAELRATLHFFPVGPYVATKIQILLWIGGKLSYVLNYHSSKVSIHLMDGITPTQRVQ